MASPLHCAAKNGNTAQILQLLKSGDQHVDLQTQVYGCTPLHLALRWGHQETAFALIHHGADIHLVDTNGVSYLHTASRNCCERVVKHLLERGAEVSCSDQWGSQPIHSAASGGSRPIMELLLRNGADVNCKGDAQETPLHKVSQTDRADLISFLIDHGAEINHVNNNGWTALHSAAYFRRHATVSTLIENGADVTVRAYNGRVPLECTVTCADGENITVCKKMRVTFDRAMSKYEHARLLALVFLLNALDLPVLVVYEIYRVAPRYPTHTVPRFGAWQFIKRVKHRL